jgi:hypothetical protein
MSVAAIVGRTNRWEGKRRFGETAVGKRIVFKFFFG